MATCMESFEKACVCVRVCVGVCALCVLEHFESSVLLEKCKINAVHLLFN